MAIHLNDGSGMSAADARIKNLERDLQAAKRGDWEAKKRVLLYMKPVLQDMATKRASTNEQINALLEAGSDGVAQAIKKFKIKSGADRFQIFALSFIEDKMDNPSKGGFFSRLFH